MSSWILALHLIFMVCWFAGLFYLPRLFIYHLDSLDEISQKRFTLMEHRLFYFIMTPAAILTSGFGIWLFALHFNYYLSQGWMLTKLLMVLMLWIYHGFCQKYLIEFKQKRNKQSGKFYRFFNEVPTLLLIIIIILAIVKP